MLSWLTPVLEEFYFSPSFANSRKLSLVGFMDVQSPSVQITIPSDCKPHLWTINVKYLKLDQECSAHSHSSVSCPCTSSISFVIDWKKEMLWVYGEQKVWLVSFLVLLILYHLMERQFAHFHSYITFPGALPSPFPSSPITPTSKKGLISKDNPSSASL